jgi:hypothetical protein
VLSRIGSEGPLCPEYEETCALFASFHSMAAKMRRKRKSDQTQSILRLFAPLYG